jgi:hypothetical protein
MKPDRATHEPGLAVLSILCAELCKQSLGIDEPALFEQSDCLVHQFPGAFGKMGPEGFNFGPCGPFSTFSSC